MRLGHESDEVVCPPDAAAAALSYDDRDGLTWERLPAEGGGERTVKFKCWLE